MTKAAWDIALTPTSNGRMVIYLPKAISEVLANRGQHRATLTITSRGLLLKPYVAGDRRRHDGPVEIPEWS